MTSDEVEGADDAGEWMDWLEIGVSDDVFFGDSLSLFRLSINRLTYRWYLLRSS